MLGGAHVTISTPALTWLNTVLTSSPSSPRNAAMEARLFTLVSSPSVNELRLPLSGSTNHHLDRSQRASHNGNRRHGFVPIVDELVARQNDLSHMQLVFHTQHVPQVFRAQLEQELAIDGCFFERLLVLQGKSQDASTSIRWTR